MTALAERTLELPEPVIGCQPGAWTSYGKRKLTFQVTEPGRFARNDYDTLYIEVIEQQPFKGEPLYVTAQRTQARNGHHRQALTDAAHKALGAALLPPIQRYGFSRAWLDAYARRMAREADGAAWEQRRLAAEQRWWADYATLAQMMADGIIELVPVTVDPHQRVPTATKLPTYGNRPPSYERIHAEARVDGELVGYLSAEGSLLPLDHDLRQSDARG